MIMRKASSTIAIAFMIVILCGGFSEAQGEDSPGPPTATLPYGQEAKTREAIARWRTFQYGMFIHFGMSTYTGEEIDPGDKPSETYAPTALNVDQWVRVARDAGMKYAVLTSKHVAGHCLWDSKVTWRGKEFDYDVATSSNKTDVIAEFTAACNKYGIEPGLYWCLLDFRNNSVPGQEQWNAWNLPDDFYHLAQDQLTELLTRYPTLSYLWLDIPRAASREQRTAIYNMIKKVKPDCVVLFNHGTGKPTGPMKIADFQAAWPTDILNTEIYMPKPGWFETPQAWQDQVYCIGYEHCDRIGKDWFWTETEAPRPVEELYKLYHNITNTGGNLLLNVPPNREGRISESHVKALMELKKMIDNPSTLSDPGIETNP